MPEMSKNAFLLNFDYIWFSMDVSPVSASSPLVFSSVVVLGKCFASLIRLNMRFNPMYSVFSALFDSRSVFRRC